MKINFIPYIYILLFFLQTQFAAAQNIQLTIQSKSNVNEQAFNGINFKKFHKDETSVPKEIDSVLTQLNKKGYLQSELDSLFKTDSLFIAEFTIGQKTETIRIFFNSADFNLPRKKLAQVSSIITDEYFEIPFEEITNTLEFLLNSFEKQGSTFSKLQLQRIRLENKLAFADLVVTRTIPRKIDRVLIKGYEKFPEKYIPFDLNLKLNSTYTINKLKNASNAIQTLTFVEETKPPEVLFTNDSTFIYLYLKKKNANRFDGVIGFNSKEEGNGIEFNGYLDLLFNNIFNSGESIALFWKNNGNESQRFYLSAETPYLFNLPIIPKATFQIFRQDSSYTNIAANFMVSYLINNQNKTNLTFSTETSNDLINNSDPNFSLQNFSNTFYGLGHTYRVLQDDNLFPEKFGITISALFGNRKTSEENTTQSKFCLESFYLFSLNYKNYIFIKNQSATLNSDNFITNEVYRIGGINTIRGFNEESIFASAYSITNLEYRYKTSNSSYFYSIIDFAYLQNEIINESNKIYSLGVGYSFLTKVGKLNLSYALGKFEDNPFKFNESKLHIQLISYF